MSDEKTKQLTKELARLNAASERAAAARAALPPGSSRARVTSANAKWSRVAEARNRVARQLAEEVARVNGLGVTAPGHCGHAPKCINDGVMDDRDPLGCCNCGTRKTEEAAEIKALRETVRMTKSLLVRLERDAPFAVWEWLKADGVLADLRETLGVKS